MSNRTRDIKLTIRLTEAEKNLFLQKQQLAKSPTMNHFIRKCVLEKEIFVVDFAEFRKINLLLSNIANNLNQLTRLANTNKNLSNITQADLKDLRNSLGIVSNNVLDIHSVLQGKIKKYNNAN